MAFIRQKYESYMLSSSPKVSASPLETLPQAGSIGLREQRIVPLGSSRSSFYRPELDALRFFAFLSVFRSHFTVPLTHYLDQDGIAPHRWLHVANNATYAGASGVDLFLVLSAYLITELLQREKERCGILDVRAFYIRRILRIWPLYFFVIGLAIIPFFNPFRDFSGRYLAAFLLLAGNWSVVAWGWPLHGIVNPLWTVSIEEQFYLLWPPLVRRLSRNRIMWAAILMVVVSTVTRIIIVVLHGRADFVRYSTLTRLDPIAAGILISVILRGRVPLLNAGVRMAMLCIGIMQLVLVARYLPIGNHLPWVPTLVSLPSLPSVAA